MTERPRASLTAERLGELFWAGLRPVLRLRLAYFRHLVRTANYPPRASDAVDPTADRVGYLGSAAAARFGVLDEDLTTLSRVASEVSASRGRPFAWVEVAPGVLTIRDAVDAPSASLADVDAIVVALGFSDVLLMTSARTWSRDLDRLLDRARRPGGVLSPVLVAGIPPMHRFRQASRLGRSRIRRQVARLNASTEVVVRLRGDCVFVPFPDPDEGSARLGFELYSWARVHRSWAAALSPELGHLLDEQA